MCCLLYYSLWDELSKYVSIYRVASFKQELCMRKGIHPIEYPRVPNIQTRTWLNFLEPTPLMLYTKMEHFSRWLQKYITQYAYRNNNKFDFILHMSFTRFKSTKKHIFMLNSHADLQYGEFLKQTSPSQKMIKLHTGIPRFYSTG